MYYKNEIIFILQTNEYLLSKIVLIIPEIIFLMFQILYKNKLCIILEIKYLLLDLINSISSIIFLNYILLCLIFDILYPIQYLLIPPIILIINKVSNIARYCIL